MNPHELHATPALRERSRTLLDRFVADPAVLTPAHSVRLAAHLMAVGAGSAAIEQLNAAREQDGTDSPEAHYLRLQLAVASGASVPSHLPGPLGDVRMAHLRAIAATLSAQPQSAATHWHHMATVSAPVGLPTDELRITAWHTLGRVRLLLNQDDARTALNAAIDGMRTYGCERDEATVMVALFEAHQRAGDRAGIVALAERLHALPGDVIGGLTPSLQCRLHATRLASQGRLIDAVRQIDAGLKVARDTRNGAAFASLAVSKADMAAQLDRPQVAWRTLVTTAAVLKRWQHPDYEAAVRHRLHQLESQWEDALPGWRATLASDLSR